MLLLVSGTSPESVSRVKAAHLTGRVWATEPSGVITHSVLWGISELSPSPTTKRQVHKGGVGLVE